jgi:hypothetical protein
LALLVHIRARKNEVHPAEAEPHEAQQSLHHAPADLTLRMSGDRPERRCELEEAGAVAVFESLEELQDSLGASLLPSLEASTRMS